MRTRSTRHLQTARKRGFTLIETALAIIIVGVGVVAIVGAQQAFHQKNMWSTHASTGTWMANEIREMMLTLPHYDPVTGTQTWGPEPAELALDDFDDLDDFDGTLGQGTIFDAADGTGPINARRQVIPNMAGWSQIVRVYNINSNNITAAYDELLDGTTEMMLVEVTVEYQGPTDPAPSEVVSMTWISPK